MPQVGNKHFAYTPKGMKSAVAYAQKTGQKVRVDKKGLGGMAKKYAKGGLAQPIEYDESTPRVGGERSAWFPEGQFFGMDVPGGAANITNILAGIAMGGVGGAGRKSLQGMAKSLAAKKSTALKAILPPKVSRNLSDDILKSGKKPSSVGPQFFEKGIIPRGQMGNVSHASKGLIKQSEKVNKAMLKADKSFQSSLKGSEGMTKPGALKKGMPVGSTNRERLDIYGKYDPFRRKVYDKASNELAKFSEMKRQFDRVGRVHRPDIYGIPKKFPGISTSVGEVASVGRRAPGATGLLPAAVRGEVTRRMGSDSYQQGGMLRGPSHRGGGIPAIVGGNQPIEMEGGEYIIKKDSAQRLGKKTLDRINQTGSLRHGGSVDSTNPYLIDSSYIGDDNRYIGPRTIPVSSLMEEAEKRADLKGGTMSLYGALKNLGHKKAALKHYGA